MRKKKIRGHKRRQEEIERWRLENLDIRLDLIEKYSYHYCDIVVHPWCDISIINSEIPEPRKTTKRLMLEALIDIYYSWQKELDKIGKTHYLKIWLFEPIFSKSQVVCAVGERIGHYENLFPEPESAEQFKGVNFGNLKERLKTLKWEYRFDEDHIESDYLGEPQQWLTIDDFVETKKWLNKTMKKPHRITKLYSGEEYYSFKKGDLWIVG